MGIIYGIRVHSWHQGLLCGVWGATSHLIYNTREQLGNWTRFVISGCSLVVFGAQFCSILSTKMQLSSSRVQLCSIWEAAPHPMYNIGVYLCTIYTIGVQLSSICVSFRSIFCHIYDARADFALSVQHSWCLGCCCCLVPSGGAASQHFLAESRDLSELGLEPGVGFVSFSLGFLTFGPVFWGGRARGSGW